MFNITAFILYYEENKDKYLKKWLVNRNINISNLQNQQKLYSIFIRYFVLEKFCNIFLPVFLNRNGKPYLYKNSIYFNISHTKNKIMIVISNKDVGMDIEKISTKRNILKIAKRYFCKSELKELVTSSNLYHDFYILWTLKESEVKRNSLGITKGFSNTTFTKNNSFWISNNYPIDFLTLLYDELIISICCENIFLRKIRLFEIVNFEFKEIFENKKFNIIYKNNI